MASLSDNVGMGMMGADVSFAKQAMQGDGKKGPLEMLLGKGISSLADFLSGKAPEGSVPSPSSSVSPVAPVMPMAPVDYSITAAQPPVAGGVVPIQQLNQPTIDQTQQPIGSYRKFLRPQSFGTPQ